MVSIDTAHIFGDGLVCRAPLRTLIIARLHLNIKDEFLSRVYNLGIGIGWSGLYGVYLGRHFLFV